MIAFPKATEALRYAIGSSDPSPPIGGAPREPIRVRMPPQRRADQGGRRFFGKKP